MSPTIVSPCKLQLQFTSCRPRTAQRLRLQKRCRPGVNASAAPNPKGQEGNGPSLLANIERNTNLLLQRYDFLSAGLGALAVTTFCVARGQDAATALWITGASTVVALLLNEILFSDERK